MRHFRVSLAVTVILLGLATWWGYHQFGWRGALAGLWVALVLSVMEVSLSFDNAVVNASVLKQWNPFWQKLFLTLGILVAVFGMRLLFPLLIVAVATGMELVQVGAMALEAPREYARLLHLHAPQVAAFGGSFLLLVFLNFVFDDQKTLHWLGRAEAKMGEFGSEGLAIVIVIAALFGCIAMVPEPLRYAVLAAGVTGVGVYAAVRWVATVLERGQAGAASRAVASG
ncbi:MAG TPA: DUF475 domain-containing protein, partial [Ramlibacter sp.]|nr:DUF475 domain-containing protein [Ramlibacter sp.]